MPDQHLSGHGEPLKDKKELARFCASRLATELLSDLYLIREILLILSKITQCSLRSRATPKQVLGSGREKKLSHSFYYHSSNTPPAKQMGFEIAKV